MHPLTASVIRHSPDAVRRPVEVAARTVDAAMRDRLPGLAAETAFWILLSLPALAVAVVAAIPTVALSLDGGNWEERFLDQALDVASVALTSQTIDSVVEPALIRLLEDSGAGIVSTAFVAALWVTSRAVKTVLTTVAIVTGRGETRKGWQQRLIGFGMTVGALLTGVILAPLLLAGPAFAEQLEGWLDRDLGPLVLIWSRAYWPTVVIVGVGVIALLYRVAVPGGLRWRDDVPGAALAVGVWLLGSAGLRFYGAWITGTESAYGPLAGPIVALLWLWLTALAVLLGAELNAQLIGRRQDPIPELSSGAEARS